MNINNRIDYNSMKYFTIIVFITLSVFPSIKAEVVDVRQALLTSQKAADTRFPNGKDLQLTHFGYIGHVTSNKGNKIYVVDQRGVITGMLAPRGLNFIVFFDAEYKYLGKIRYVDSRPLWCVASQVFLFGEISTPNGEGNVIDLSNGFQGWSVKSVKAYGSHQ